MPPKKVLIIGASGHAKVIIDIFEQEAKYEILGLLDENKQIGEKVLGYEIIGTLENLPQIYQENPACSLFIAIGDNWIRQEVKNKIMQIYPKAKFISAIHPSAQIGKNVQIGVGVAIMAGVIINSNTKICDFSIINTKASIDHDNFIADFVNIAPNVTTGGNVSVGEFSVLSISATLIHNIVIGNHTVIGAGALVLQNFGDNLVVYGSPAKEIRQRTIGEKYL